MSDPVEHETPPTAPPTAPGPIPPRNSAVTNRNSVASMACGFFGFLVPLVNVAAIVLGIVSLRQINRRRPNESGAAFAIIGIVAGVLGIGSNLLIGFMTWSIVDATRTGFAMRGPAPAAVHVDQLEYAARHDRYPDHVAELMLGDDGIVIPNVIQRNRLGTPGVVMIGTFDASRYNYSSEQAAKLEAALEELDTTDVVYRFGQCWFVRLGAPRNRSDLVAAWSVDSGGAVHLVFDDGTEARDVDEIMWNGYWVVDGGARLELGLDRLERPPFPTTDW